MITTKLKGYGLFKNSKGTLINCNDTSLKEVDDYIDPTDVMVVDIFEAADETKVLPLYISNVDNINDIKDHSNKVEIYSIIDGDELFKDMTQLEYATLDVLNANANRMFYNSSVKKAVIKKITKNAERMFANCESLEDVDFKATAINCDYIFENDWDYALRIGKEGVKNTLKKFSVYNKWADGENRTYFWNCPYGGVLSDYHMQLLGVKDDYYTWQKNNNNFDTYLLVLKAAKAVGIDKRIDSFNKQSDSADISYDAYVDSFNLREQTGTYEKKIVQKQESYWVVLDSRTGNGEWRNRTVNVEVDDTTKPIYKYTKTTANRPESSNYNSFIDINNAKLNLHLNQRSNYKILQNILYNIKDIWSFGNFESTNTPTFNLNTSIILNNEYNLNRLLNSVWVPEDKLRLRLTSFDIWKHIAVNTTDWYDSVAAFTSNLSKYTTGQYYSEESVPATDLSHLFEDNLFIKSIELSYSKITKADYMFAGCKSIDYGNGVFSNNGDYIVSANHMFDGACKNPDLENLIVKTKYADYVFANADLQDPSFFKNWTYVESARYAFSGSTIQHLNKDCFSDVIQDVSYAFADCKSLVDVKGNWLEPNTSMHYQNAAKYDGTTFTDIWQTPTTTEGISFPDTITRAECMFSGSSVTSVRDLKLPLNAVNEHFFYNCADLVECYNIYLNENNKYKNIFVNVPQSKDKFRIWFPIHIDDTFSDVKSTGLDPEKVPNVYCDDWFITVNGEESDILVKRRGMYERCIDPNNDFTILYFTHPHPHSINNYRYTHIVHDAVVLYK